MAPLKPELVVEVRYDHVTGDRFRHGTGFLRWRPDKAPRQCTLEQLAPELRPSQLIGAVRRLAHLVAGEALGDPARRGQALRSVGSSGGSHSVRSITRTRGIGRQAAHCVKEVVDRHSARPRTRRPRELRAVDHVDVAIDHQRIAMRDMVERAVDGMGNAAVANIADA